MAAASTLAQDQQFVFHPWRAQRDRLSIQVVGGEGPYFFDADGKRYLDFHSGWAHLNLGHQPPRVIAAIVEQAQRLCNVTPDYAHERASELGQNLAALLPGDLGKCFFSSGGTDAVETAIKMARAYTGRHKIISRYRSYHGNTYGAGTVSGDPRRFPLEPSAPGIVRALDQYCYRCPFGLTYPACGVHCADHIADLIELEGAGSVAAVIAEPVVSANGGLVPPPEYWPKLREICDRYGVLLIADEVVTGLGRTGMWFACDHWGVVPDIMVLAKGLTAGLLPLGAVAVRQPIADFFEDHYLPAGLTYQSHPLSCAAALATIDTIVADDLLENARRMGAQLQDGLRALQTRHPSVGDIRGLGLYAVLELVRDRATKEPLVPWNASAAESEGTRELNRILLERGVRVAVRWNRLSVAPPLIVGQGDVEAGLAAIDAALDAADAWYTG
jgi:taurine---2-oxoglutarate transaminase